MVEKQDSSSSNEIYNKKKRNYSSADELNELYNDHYNQISKKYLSDKIPFTYYPNQNYPSNIRKKSIHSYLSSNVPSDLKKRLRICQNCRVTNSPSWRKSPCGKFMLCNACGLYARLHNRDRPFIPTRDGRTKVVKRQTPQNVTCFYCKEINNVYPRLELGNKPTCDFCWNNFILQTSNKYYSSNDYSTYSYNTSYEPMNPTNNNFFQYSQDHGYYSSAAMPREDFYRVTEVYNFNSEKEKEKRQKEDYEVEDPNE